MRTTAEMNTSPEKVASKERLGNAIGGRNDDVVSLNTLRENILRRIIRAGCALGVLGIVIGALFVRPFNLPSALIGLGATVLVFGATLLPTRFRILSRIYPWALVATGIGIASVMGPRTESFLLASGGLFMGALVLGGLQWGVLAGVTVIAGSAVYVFGPAPPPELGNSIWINSVDAMAAVVLPSSIAGRMLVGALDKALSARQALVHELVDESRELEKTLAALENTRAQLTHAQKVELIGQIAGGIAHDMNNALTAVMGEASMLDDSVGAERERIIEAASYASKLTHQLMVFGRRDTSNPRPVDLCREIRGLLKAVRRVIPSEITFDADIPNETIAVVADPVHILQILLNLAGNAKDAITDGGISISVRREDEGAEQVAVVSMSDTGAGIPEDVLPRIFEPFFTTKPAGRGTGLGLANVRRLVEEMGGVISVESEAGKGTTFTICIPVTDRSVNVESRIQKSNASRSGTVLVVDDDVRVRAVVYTALEQVGYEVLEAATPEAAAAAACARNGIIDLLLTDVVMPGGGAAEVIRLVQKEYPAIRVMVMSGYNDDETLKRGIRQGAYPFIAKPFTADTLVEAVDSALA